MTLLILTLVYVGLWFTLMYFESNGYLNDKQYKMYFIILFIVGLFLCGLLERYCNIKNGY
jgi:hypothetical protein